MVTARSLSLVLAVDRSKNEDWGLRGMRCVEEMDVWYWG
jgi:hypothetical protein